MIAVTVATMSHLGGCSGSGKPAVAPAAIEGSSETPVADPKAIANLDEGERQIEVAAGDCGAACGGVSMMTKARVALCSPRTSACADAERREGDARRRVAGFCDACGGP
jgi:hypothetical protein